MANSNPQCFLTSLSHNFLARQGSPPGSSSCVTCNDQEWTWQKCNNDQCPKAANKNAAGDCKCKKAHNWSRGKQKCVKK